MMTSGWRVLGLILLMAAWLHPVQAKAIRQVQAILVDTNSVNIQLDNLSDKSKINVRRLANPNRVVVDMDNAQVAEDKVIPVNKEGIQSIELKGSRTPIHNSARITLLVDDERATQSVEAEETSEGLKLSFSPADMMKWMRGGAGVPAMAANRPSTLQSGVVPGSADRTVVSNIDYSAGQVIIKSSKGVRVKNQFVLRAPNRLVIDLDNAVLAHRGLIGNRSFADNNITQVRLGQFNDNTVRVTIQAENPAKLEVSQPEHGVMIVASDMPAVSAAPQEVVPGFLQNIYLDNQSGNTQIRVHTSVPMKQKLTRSGNTMHIDMDNIAAVAGLIRYNQADFPQVKRMWIEKRGDGCRINIIMDDSNARLQTAMYSAKKILEVNVGNTVAMSPSPGFQRLPAGTMRVVIDAGHGGKDMGANRDGINEKDLNLSVAHKLRQALEARGVKVSMTRTHDVFLPLPEITSINNGINPDVFVSVHTNSSTNPNITGIETYFYTPQSIPLANRVHQQMVSRVNSPDRGVRQARFYVIHHTRVPAILCETGYISNPAERYSLTTELRQNATANAIADGVVDYLKTRLTASTGNNPATNGTTELIEDTAPPQPASEPLVVVPDAPEVPMPTLPPAAAMPDAGQSAVQ
jgi:N-acetylmuramoyl-L-alanine amidase